MVFITVFFIVFISRLICTGQHLHNVRKAKKRLSAFVYAYEHRTVSFLRPEMEYEKPMEKMMRYVPTICKYVTDPKLSYGRPDVGKYECAKLILNQMKMECHFRLDAFRHCLNPLTTIKAIFLAPARIFRKLKLPIGNFASAVIAIITGVTVEIITSLLRELIPPSLVVEFISNLT